MATENLDKIYSLPAGADFTGKSGYGVVINSSGELALAGAAVVPHGYIHGEGVAQGKMQRFVHHGSVLRYKAAGNIAAGAKLTTHASGFATAAATNPVSAIALEAAVAGDVAAALFLPGLPAAT